MARIAGSPGRVGHVSASSQCHFWVESRYVYYVIHVLLHVIVQCIWQISVKSANQPHHDLNRTEMC